MHKCENCVHAKVTTGRSVTVKNGMMLVQQTPPGGKNITCGARGIREITFINDEMLCSSFKEKRSQTTIRYTFTEDDFITLCGLKKVVHHLETLKTLTKSTPSTLGDDIAELNSQIHALITNAEETVEEVED